MQAAFFSKNTCEGAGRSKARTAGVNICNRTGIYSDFVHGVVRPVLIDEAEHRGSADSCRAARISG